jgi:excisionase family DNA binding protein
LLRLDEVAEILRAPLGTVRHWYRLGKLRGARVGRRVLFRSSEIARFLREVGL